MSRSLVVIAHDIRSTHNVGSLMRTCEGLGVEHVYLTGYTPYPTSSSDSRLPHLSAKIDKQIDKTGLGAAHMVPWTQAEDVMTVLAGLKADGYQVVGLEQTATSVPLPEFRASDKLALLLGREVEGIDAALLKQCDATVEIPMFGHKESFNVVQAAAMALYAFRFQ